MTKAGRRLIDGAREAESIAKGEVPAARMHIRGHAYVPEGAVAEAVARECDRCAAVADSFARVPVAPEPKDNLDRLANDIAERRSRNIAAAIRRPVAP